MAVLPLLLAPPRAWWVASLSPDARIGLLETFPKQTFRNRIRIQQRNGVLLDISLPIVHDAGRTTANVRLEKSGWERSLWRSLTAAYAYTPFGTCCRPNWNPCFAMSPTNYLFIHSESNNGWLGNGVERCPLWMIPRRQTVISLPKRVKRAVLEDSPCCTSCLSTARRCIFNPCVGYWSFCLRRGFLGR